MSDAQEDFYARLGKIHAQRAASHQAVQSAFVDQDGYVIVRARRHGLSLPVGGAALLVAGFFGMKGALMAQLGPDFYSQRVTHMAAGNPVSQAGAYAMRPDPVSRYVARNLKSLF